MNGNTTNCPCYDCDIRQPACHDACKAYISWADKRRQLRIKERTSSDAIVNEYYCTKRYRGK